MCTYFDDGCHQQLLEDKILLLHQLFQEIEKDYVLLNSPNEAKITLIAQANKVNSRKKNTHQSHF